jgi:hypothetical protein
MTGGVPRQINHVCDNALLICMTKGMRKVNRRILRKAEEALGTDLIFTPQRLSGKRGLLKAVIPITVSLAVLTGIIFFYLGFGIIKKSSITQSVTSGFERSAFVERAKASPTLNQTVFLASFHPETIIC